MNLVTLNQAYFTLSLKYRKFFVCTKCIRNERGSTGCKMHHMALYLQAKLVEMHLNLLSLLCGMGQLPRLGEQCIAMNRTGHRILDGRAVRLSASHNFPSKTALHRKVHANIYMLIGIIFLEQHT